VNLVKTCHILAKDQTLPTAGKESPYRNWLKGYSSQNTVAEGMQHTPETLSEVPGPGPI